MLRNWKQVCLLSNHLRSFGHIYPTSTSKEILRQEQTFASLCGGCIRQIKLFHIPLTNAGSPLKREGPRHLHQSEFVKPNYDVVSTSSKDADSNHEEITLDWTVHERLIGTCSGIWDECPDGSSFIVSYVDTAWLLTKAEKVRLPTVLAPARDLAHSDSLKPLLGSLARNGFRVIMPYLVGSELTRGLTHMDEERFSHTLGERSSFLLDFLSSTGIQRFDVALGHCLECFPILTLASNFQIFDSVVFICPIPGHVAPRWIYPLSISLKMTDWFKSSVFSPVASLYFHTYVRQKLSTDHRATVKELHSYVELSHGINYDTVSGFAMMFESRRIPILYIYCDADPVVDSRLSAEFAEIFGITSGLTNSYDASGQLVEKASQSTVRYAKALRLSSRTHFPHNEKPLRDIILKEVTGLYKDTLAKRTRNTAS